MEPRTKNTSLTTVLLLLSWFSRSCLFVEGLAGCPPPLRLKQLLESEMDGTRDSENPILLPCCYDGLTARLITRAGFDATFMTGFGVSAVNGYPDTQLISYGEMQFQTNIVAEGLSSAALEMGKEPIPCIADGDTGYGNSVNVKRTVFGYGRAGMAGIMIEDQVAPKRCGHVAGKSVIPIKEAISRVKAACDARDEYESQFGPGTGPLILARTDALKTDGFEAGIERCLAFQDAGCDMTFLEAPESIEQMQEYCRRVKGPKLANMLEQGCEFPFSQVFRHVFFYFFTFIVNLKRLNYNSFLQTVKILSFLDAHYY